MSVPVCRRLEGRVAVVTGGGGGIGLATVRRLATEGAHVVVADINPDAAKSGAEEVDGLPVPADVSDSEDVKRLFGVAHERYGRIDIAFNNAGISPPKMTPYLLLELTPGDTSRTSTSRRSTSAAPPSSPTCSAPVRVR